MGLCTGAPGDPPLRWALLLVLAVGVGGRLVGILRRAQDAWGAVLRRPELRTGAQDALLAAAVAFARVCIPTAFTARKILRFSR